MSGQFAIATRFPVLTSRESQGSLTVTVMIL
jgi:hypothetical protein